MTLSQLQYIISLDDHRNFTIAAVKCHVTQATLSMMVRKLEDELGVRIFDRVQPLRPTRQGKEIIAKARQIVQLAGELMAHTSELKNAVSGELRLSIIPTLAPYLLPLFINRFSMAYPDLKVYVREMVTEDIVAALHSGETDIGLLAAPLNDPSLVEHHLFYEEFQVYSSKEYMPRKKYLLAGDIKPDQLWLLEEGHCMRSQVIDLCELKKPDLEKHGVHYSAGSIETLVNLVDRTGGITIIPHLAAAMLKPGQKKHLKEFAKPRPMRQIVLATHSGYPRQKIVQALKDMVLRCM